MNKKILKSLFAPIGKGLLIFAVFGAALYAYAAVTFPASAPGEASGILGIYAGAVAASTGNMGGYSGANASCSATHAGSHLCSVSEVVNSYNHNVTTLPTTGAIMWVSNGPSFLDSSVANDCQGWTSNTSSNLGTGWYFGATNGYGGITPCSLSYQLACCR